MRNNLPPELFPPGSTIAYSNYGAALAGEIVERVSHLPFQDYEAENILRPLNMSHSTFEQPLPAPFVELMSRGYLRASLGQPMPFELIAASPAGGFSTTAEDMTHFMLAQFATGSAADSRLIVSPQMQAMHVHQHSLAPEMNGFALGFYEESRNGHRIVGHGGDTVAFHSDLHLILDADVGFFIAFNSAGVDDAAENARVYIFKAFLDRYFPAPPAAPHSVFTQSSSVSALLGHYVISRRHQSSFLKLTNLLNQFTVERNSDGTISFDLFKDDAGAPMRWREVGPFKFQEVGGQAHMQFVPDSTGRVRSMMSDAYLPVFEFQPAPVDENNAVVIPLMVFIAAVFAGGLAFPMIGRLVRWKLDVPRELPVRLKRATSLSASVCGLNLLLLTLWFVLLVSTAGLSTVLHSSFDPWLIALYVLGCLTILANALIFYKMLLTWRALGHSMLARFGDGLVAAGSVCFIGVLVTYHLISFGLRY